MNVCSVGWSNGTPFILNWEWVILQLLEHILAKFSPEFVPNFEQLSVADSEGGCVPLCDSHYLFIFNAILLRLWMVVFRLLYEYCCLSTNRYFDTWNLLTCNVVIDPNSQFLYNALLSSPPWNIDLMFIHHVSKISSSTNSLHIHASPECQNEACDWFIVCRCRVSYYLRTVFVFCFRTVCRRN